MKKRKLRLVGYKGPYNKPKQWEIVADVSMQVCSDNWGEWKQLQERVFEPGRELHAQGIQCGNATFVSGRRVWGGWSNFVRCCDLCGVPYEAPNKQSRYCSECGKAGAQKKQAAKRKAERQARLSATKCETCGEMFTPKRRDARFCCAKCRVYWNRQQAKAAAGLT